MLKNILRSLVSNTDSDVIQKRKLKVSHIHFKVMQITKIIEINLIISACHLLGDYLESIKKDFEKASKVYRSNCDDYGYARSCLKYGNYSFLGKGKSGSSGSVSEAYKYYEKGCTLNEADSCLHSGLILVSRSMKEEVNRDVKKVCVKHFVG